MCVILAVFPGLEMFIKNWIHLLCMCYLTYDYSYSGFSGAHSDGLRIDISNDCGSSWDSIFSAYGSDLATTSYQTSVWYPTCNSWKTDSINLTNLGYINDTIMIRFVAINDYGNQFYMDNVNINGKNILAIENIEKLFHLYVFPNPTKGRFTIKTDIEKIEVNIYSTLGKLILREMIINGNNNIDLTEQESGVYFMQFNINGKPHQRKLILQ